MASINEKPRTKPVKKADSI